MLQVAIIGASGYTGVELTRILCNHPEFELTAATSRQYAGKALSEVFPNLLGKTDLICENLSVDELCQRADLFFAAVPHKTAMDLVPRLLQENKKLVDLSADYRLRDVAVYEEWYQEHSSPEFIKEAAYGLPELYREQIKNARLVANPGCYPTSIVLGLAPLLQEGLIDPATIIVDSKSGTTGAGRAVGVATLFCEVHDGFKAYKVGGTHRHLPEIEQELSVLNRGDVTISFTPHLLPISRGILSTSYANLTSGISEDNLRKLYMDRYTAEPFVRMVPKGTFPATQHVRGSNFCDIGFAIDKRTNRIIVVSAIDNIVKGAAGQAVHNMNLMCGIDETTGLEGAPFFP
ncbi:MAG: N-acetyl-gamma-glutamyl-phosphate reductase [Thermodesulfobacteriota bacterium]|nr:N-acetyl-gamma-glutamyl-phosphate reductase [Thermodesulfobacteriota bacterium]